MAKQAEKKAETIVDVQQVYTRTERFLDKNRKGLTIALGSVVVLFGAFFAYQYLYKKPQEEKASNAIMKADLWAEKDSLEWAVMGHGEYEGYEALASKFDGTKVGKRAHFWCGVYYRDKKADYAAALEHFKQADFDDQAVGVEATGCVGDMYVMQGNIEEGASWLEKAAKRANSSDSRDFTGPVYGLKAAKAYLELGKNDKAKSLLQYVVDNYPKTGQEYSEADKMLAYIKAME